MDVPPPTTDSFILRHRSQPSLLSTLQSNKSKFCRVDRAVGRGPWGVRSKAGSADDRLQVHDARRTKLQHHRHANPLGVRHSNKCAEASGAHFDLRSETGYKIVQNPFQYHPASPLPSAHLQYIMTFTSSLLRNGPTLTKKALFATTASSLNNVVIVSGVRLPFSMTTTIYKDELAIDLQKMAIQGLLTETALPKDQVDYVIAGNVIQEVRTSNIAREAAINAGLPVHIGAHTIAQACISSNAAICAAAEKILTGHADVVIAGGTETFSDVPIRLTRPVRQRLITLPKAMKKGGVIGGARHFFRGLKTKDFGLETPAISNYTTGEVMGVSSDKLSAKFGVSRGEQDEFTVRSHHMAGRAHADGWYIGEVIPYKGSTQENGIKADSSIESVGKLKPAFVKPHGTHTAANSSFLTDGASATLVMSEKKALELGYKPLAYLRDWSFKACDPFEQLLLGPTYCTHEILTKNKLNLQTDVGVYEIHEAFAGQILSNLTAMNSQKFADENLGGKKVGEVRMDKLNIKGGSLAIGHPFGATGSRLVTTASRRLQDEGERFALIAACADGGMGHACLLERYDN